VEATCESSSPEWVRFVVAPEPSLRRVLLYEKDQRHVPTKIKTSTPDPCASLHTKVGTLRRPSLEGYADPSVPCQKVAGTGGTEPFPQQSGYASSSFSMKDPSSELLPLAQNPSSLVPHRAGAHQNPPACAPKPLTQSVCPVAPREYLFLKDPPLPTKSKQTSSSSSLSMKDSRTRSTKVPAGPTRRSEYASLGFVVLLYEGYARAML